MTGRLPEYFSALGACVGDFDTIKAHMDSCSICAEALTGTGPRDKQTILKRLEHVQTVHPALATLIPAWIAEAKDGDYDVQAPTKGEKP